MKNIKPLNKNIDKSQFKNRNEISKLYFKPRKDIETERSRFYIHPKHIVLSAIGLMTAPSFLFCSGLFMFHVELRDIMFTTYCLFGIGLVVFCTTTFISFNTITELFYKAVTRAMPVLVVSALFFLILAVMVAIFFEQKSFTLNDFSRTFILVDALSALFVVVATHITMNILRK